MTAPCEEGSDGGIVCQCPVFSGPFQVQGKARGCEGLPSGAFSPKATPESPRTYSLVPKSSCKAKVKVCYEGSKKAVESVLLLDALNCVGEKESSVEHGSCPDYGYPKGLGHDPIFREVSIYTKDLLPIYPTSLDGRLERCEKRGKKYKIEGKKKALVITTSHGKLGPNNCTSCKKTGVSSPEFTIPYYIFQDAGMDVTLASIVGGPIPIDPVVKYFTHWDVRFWDDAVAVQSSLRSPSISDLDFGDYDVIYMAGGWGAAWDLGFSTVLAKGVTKAFAKGTTLGSVCHGALGFINALRPDGSLLVNGTNMSAVTDRQLEQLQIAKLTPIHPEDALKERGAHFFANHGILTDIDQSKVVVDGTIVTGQNQNSACETAQRMLDQIV